MSKQTSLGIIGTGAFGRFVADKLADHFEIRLVGRGNSVEDRQAAAKSDYVVLAIPFEAYDAVLADLKPLLGPATVIVDVCSVKVKPLERLSHHLPGRTILATHPLFGPETAAGDLTGHNVVLCPQPGAEEFYDKAEALFSGLGLVVSSMTAEEHDRLMAELQGLTFYVAEALARYDVGERAIMTPSYRRLLGLAELERRHSPELFRTIQNANPYTTAVRDRFRSILGEIEADLEQHKENHGQ